MAARPEDCVQGNDLDLILDLLDDDFFEDEESLQSELDMIVSEIVSLTLDGLTGACQEKMRAKAKTSPHHMMQAVNAWSFLVLGSTIIFTGELWKFIDFCLNYPFIIKNIIGFSLMSALGQNFIFMTVSNFGPLPCSIATTTRKFFTILFSVLFFGNLLIPRQWIGVALVFLGLGMDAYFGKSRK